MKIFVTGIEGSGKNSLAKELASELNISLIDQQYTDVATSYLGMIQTTGQTNASDMRKQFVQKSLQWLSKLDTHLKESDVILHRSCIDVASLWLANNIGQARPDVFLQLLDICQKQMSKIDYLILCPGYNYEISADLKDQSIPANQETYQKIKLNSILLGLLGQYDTKKIVLIPNSLVAIEDRKKFVLEKIKAKTIKKK